MSNKVKKQDAFRIKRLQLEKRIYEICGVKRFRKCVFALEKWIHRKDKGTNINYHISSVNSAAIKEFIKYLFYNGAIHVRNLIYYCVFCIVRYSIYPSFHYFDIIPIAFAIKDLYCVMLQRYNYIQIQLRLPRLEELRKARMDREVRKITSVIQKTDYDASILQSDLETIQTLRTMIDKGESIVLRDEDQAAYKRLANILTKAKEQQ